MPFTCKGTANIQVQVKHSWESLGKCLMEISSCKWSHPSSCEEVVTALILQKMTLTQRAQPPKASREGLFLWKASTKMATVKYLEMLLSEMVPGPQAAPDLRFPHSPTPLSKNITGSANMPHENLLSRTNLPTRGQTSGPLHSKCSPSISTSLIYKELCRYWCDTTSLNEGSECLLSPFDYTEEARGAHEKKKITPLFFLK